MPRSARIGHLGKRRHASWTATRLPPAVTGHQPVSAGKTLAYLMPVRDVAIMSATVSRQVA